MPKTTEEKTKKVTEKKPAPKTAKATKAKKENSKKVPAKKTTSKKVASTTTKTVAKKTASTAKKTATKKVESKAKKTTSKKSASSKTVAKKEEVKREEKINEQSVIEKIKAFIAKIVAMQEEASEEAREEKVEKKSKARTKKAIEAKPSYILEYYDLPYRYNETVVKILAQTPKRLFVYWDISDKDREKYLLAFGDRFFEETYPVLLVHNEDMNYTFEVPINDFANSWYLDINDSKSKYTIQLGRKFRNKPEKVNIVASTETENVKLYNDYVPIITSNMLEVPNDHILFENIQSKVLYRNVKNGEESTVDIDNIEFSKRIGHIYSIYDVYKEIYKNELDNKSLVDLLNPSSMSSSMFR